MPRYARLILYASGRPDTGLHAELSHGRWVSSDMIERSPRSHIFLGELNVQTRSSRLLVAITVTVSACGGGRNPSRRAAHRAPLQRRRLRLRPSAPAPSAARSSSRNAAGSRGYQDVVGSALYAGRTDAVRGRARWPGQRPAERVRLRQGRARRPHVHGADRRRSCSIRRAASTCRTCSVRRSGSRCRSSTAMRRCTTSMRCPRTTPSSTSVSR